MRARLRPGSLASGVGLAEHLSHRVTVGRLVGLARPPPLCCGFDRVRLNPLVTTTAQVVPVAGVASQVGPLGSAAPMGSVDRWSPPAALAER